MLFVHAECRVDRIAAVAPDAGNQPAVHAVDVLGAVEASKADEVLRLVDPAPAARHRHLHAQPEARAEAQRCVMIA